MLTSLTTMMTVIHSKRLINLVWKERRASQGRSRHRTLDETLPLYQTRRTFFRRRRAVDLHHNRWPTNSQAPPWTVLRAPGRCPGMTRGWLDQQTSSRTVCRVCALSTWPHRIHSIHYPPFTDSAAFYLSSLARHHNYRHEFEVWYVPNDEEKHNQ